MTRILLFLSICFFACNLSTYAQPGSILLKDVTNTTIGTYSTIVDAYNAIPVPITGNYAIEIDTGYHGTMELSPMTFGAKAGASSTRQITIRFRYNILTGYCPGGAVIKGDLANAPLIILDGVQWLTIDGLTCGGYKGRGLVLIPSFPTPLTPVVHPSLLIKNNASNNTIRNCMFYGNGGNDQHDKAAILLGTGSTGNNNNKIEQCDFYNLDNIFRSAGTPASPNSNNLFSRNYIELCYENMVTADSGTAALKIDSNDIYAVNGRLAGFTGIRINHMEDTLNIRNNNFYLIRTSPDSASTAILLSPGTAKPDHYCLLANNFIRWISGYESFSGSAALSPAIDTTMRLTGIDIGGSVPCNVSLLYNTVRITRTISPTTSRSLYSAAFHYSGLSGSNVRALNNIFVNTRNGGAPGSVHAAMDLTTLNGLTTDYNTYNAANISVRVSGTPYSTFSGYKAVYSTRDQLSNDTVVLFENMNSGELSALMYNNTGLQGIADPQVSEDSRHRNRTYPYRGVSELTADCSVNALGVSVSSISDSICYTNSVLLSYSRLNNINGVVHQWQSRPSGTGPFTDIAGAHATEYLASQTVSTDYRVKDSCVAGGNVYYTAPRSVWIRSKKNEGVLSATMVNGLNYRITVTGRDALIADGDWFFGDGTSTRTTSDNVTHLYPAPGQYNIFLVPHTPCTTEDTIFLTLIIPPTSVGNMTSRQDIRVFPNPARDAVYIESADKIKMKALILIDATGKTIYSQQIPDANRGSLQLGNRIPSGNYFLKIITENNVLHQPLTILR